MTDEQHAGPLHGYSQHLVRPPELVAVIHFYTRVVRGDVTVIYLTEQHNVPISARARTLDLEVLSATS